MPIDEFSNLPDSSRVWVFGADRDVGESEAGKLLDVTDDFLAGWRAHGFPLTSGRDWSEDRFLTIAVDQEQEGASGCSIDALFRSLRELGGSLGANLVTSGLVYFRASDGSIRSVSRDEFSELASRGEINGDTEVFDLSVTTLGEWRARFASKAVDSWHFSLMGDHARP